MGLPADSVGLFYSQIGHLWGSGFKNDHLTAREELAQVPQTNLNHLRFNPLTVGFCKILHNKHKSCLIAYWRLRTYTVPELISKSRNKFRVPKWWNQPHRGERTRM